MVYLIPLFPLFGFLLLCLFNKVLSRNIIGLIGCGTVLASFVYSAYLFYHFTFSNLSPFTVNCFDWIHAGTFTASFSLLVDPLSVLSLMIITGVGFLIHVYSVGYMHDDEGFGRYFSYLNLFIFFMLLLVLGSNYLVMFVGWEGVGLCSYLLIGFWFKNANFNNAARKAFVMN